MKTLTKKYKSLLKDSYDYNKYAYIVLDGQVNRFINVKTMQGKTFVELLSTGLLVEVAEQTYRYIA